MAQQYYSNMFSNKNQTVVKENYHFDVIIGHIEDILVDESFHKVISDFMEKYYQAFEKNEENKLIYMDIFSEYTKLLENFIDTHLTNRIPDFCMKQFICELEKMKMDLEGEVFEMLFTLSDFLIFKEMMLDYRDVKEGLVVDFSSDVVIKSLSNENSEKW